MKKQISPKIVSLIFAILVICFAIAFYAFSWTEPTALPPGDNVPPPLNISSIGQTKQGYLALNTAGSSPTGLIVNGDAIFLNGNVGIGTTSPSKKLEVVGGPIKATGGLIIETRTSDPASPETGRMWLRTDI